MSNLPGTSDTPTHTRTVSPERHASNPPAESSGITSNMTVNELLAARPEASGLLLELGIDTCCGGSLPLGEAAADAGVDFDRIASLLDAEAALPSESARR